MTKNNNNNTVTISNYINTNYRDYSIYTNNNRAIPSVIDGFKPVQRKSIFVGIKEARNRFIKVAAFGGALVNNAAYHHAPESAENAIIGMVQDFNNNIAFLEGDGTFGTRQSPTAGAARYIFAKLHDNFNLVFKDNDILEQSSDPEDHPEPLFYLPIIPTVLLNGVQGMSVGFATKIAPRSHVDLCKACIQVLQGKKVTNKLLPSFPDFRGEVIQIDDGKFSIEGTYEFQGSSKYKLTVTELPIGISHEQYITHLEKLLAEKKILNYDDDTADRFRFNVQLPQKPITDSQIKDLLNLKVSFSENITVVNEFDKVNGNVSIDVYDNPVTLLEEFVEFRTSYYVKRIQHNIDIATSEISLLEDKIRFIKEVVAKKIKIDKMTRSEVVDHLSKSKAYNNDNISKIVGMSLFSLTKDSIDRLEEQLQTEKDNLSFWQKADATTLYIDELKELQKLKV